MRTLCICPGIKYMLYDYLGVWAVVNNAGFNIRGDVELSTVDQYKKCAEVNLYGMIRVIKAFLPMIRASRGKGVTACKSIF